MKHAAFLVVLVVSIMACSADSIKELSAEKVIRYKETVALPGSATGTLTFAEVTDSRCADGATCIWAGNATVDLELKSTATTEGQSIRLCLGDCKSLYPNAAFRSTDTVQVQLDNQRYSLILTDVSPYPRLSEVAFKKEAYTIKLILKSL
ncbi:hypothetical protein [Arundinibacter roseus]|uniref:Lipoprotein n=1 Tax=Arundinibacter roseus TaxID=2070510 RepID=A0A4R4KDD3_9BACT|nr:hypothetical protein [Arundinibacter roseus]TDB65924.1 hypothetical protein EZE20_09155 [Arundinibacter roseus]